MSKTKRTAITPTREEDYPAWYLEVIKEADLAEHSVVRGCMVIKPWGCALWENIQSILDKKIKETGHQNFYFPLFIPLSFLAKEAEHIEGFAKECAVVTHHRLEKNDEKGLVPAGELEEPLIIRPTSEVVIGEAFSRWIKSYRDLPLLGNQWANVVRWEMRTRLFLRTSEFLWQEGHTAHAESKEAIEEAEKMLDVYRILAEEFLAMPVICGKKTENEKFPGAEITYCIESMMQDKKALQAGTSHFLGQSFSKAFDIKYLSREGRQEHVWTTSWGVSTRLIGGLIMTHSDDDGLVLPPKVAPIQIVIIPLIHKLENTKQILNYCEALASDLKAQVYSNSPLKVEIDTKEKGHGDKVWGWVKKGVPIRLEIGMKEVENNAVYMARRDLAPNEKKSIEVTEFAKNAVSLLEEIQQNLFIRAQKYREENSIEITSVNEFYKFFEEKSGFVYSYWSGDEKTEDELKQKLKVTARCIPLNGKRGKCIFTGKEDSQLTIFAKAY